MILPSQLVSALIAQLKLLPELVTLVGGNSAAIYSYSDQFPRNSSLQLAIHQMPVPSVMAVWMGTQFVDNGSSTAWAHKITLYVRTGDVADSYATAFRAIVHSVPTGRTQSLLNDSIVATCDAMDPSYIQRQTDSEGLDYFEIPLAFNEIGDF